jgi:hypothetical protein
MVFVADAFGGWLVGQVAEAGRKRLGNWLLGSEQERALHHTATAAIHAAARQLRPWPTTADDPQDADHLARVIDEVFQTAPTPAESLAEHPTLLQGLQAGVAGRLAVLGDAQVTETGQSSAELLGVTVPSLAETLTSHLVREIVTRGAGGGPLTPLADKLNHDLTHLQGQQHSVGLTRLTTDLQAALATLDRLGQQAQSIPARTIPLGRPIHELTDPFALEVHRAIDAPDRATPLPALPAYVERDHDRQLRAIVKQVADGGSAAAVLVGGSSTGKTRACWEAVQTLPKDWRLWHPIDPSRPEAAADALPAVGPRTVIWLNEAQHYLLTPESQLGERVAARLRELLRDPARGAVLVLGTIWPEYWATLTATPPAGQRQDPHAQARALLTGIDIPIPDTFTGPALRAVQAAAGADPRLAEAVTHAEEGRITQFLAGGPALLERYRNAPAAARALIEAAMDARRLGHSLFIPHSLLAAAAPGYLTDQQWDEVADHEDWLESALAYCAAPCRGARGPLTRRHPRPGQPAPSQRYYRLADYLEQTGRVMRRAALAPASLWDALVDHADGRALPRIAEEAERRSLYRHAFRLYQRAAEAGDPFVLRRAAWLLERAGRTEEAISFYQRAAEAGDHDALRQAAELLERTGRIEEAIAWLQTRAEAGDHDALRQVAKLLERAGRTEEAISFYYRAAEAGDRSVLPRAAGLLAEVGRTEEAIAWLQTRAEAGDRDALWQAAWLLERAGRTEEAIGFYQRAAEAGDHDALRRAAGLLERAGRIEEATAWLQTRAEAGDHDALRQAVKLLERVGRTKEAIAWLQTRAEAGDRDAALQRVELLVEAADRLTEARARNREAAINLHQRAAKSRYRDGLRGAAEALERVGLTEMAIRDYQRAAEAGDHDALRRAARLLGRAGRIEEAVAWLLTRAEVGDHDALQQAARLLKRAGRTEEAIGFYQRAAEAGDHDALQQAARLLERAGRTEETIGLYQRVADAGDHDALRRAAGLLERAGRIEEAVAWLLTHAEAGDHDALQQAAELLERAGRTDEAARLHQYGLEPGTHIGNEWHLGDDPMSREPGF